MLAFERIHEAGRRKIQKSVCARARELGLTKLLAPAEHVQIGDKFLTCGMVDQARTQYEAAVVGLLAIDMDDVGKVTELGVLDPSSARNLKALVCHCFRSARECFVAFPWHSQYLNK